jgi:hypothetical protein
MSRIYHEWQRGITRRFVRISLVWLKNVKYSGGINHYWFEYQSPEDTVIMKSRHGCFKANLNAAHTRLDYRDQCVSWPCTNSKALAVFILYSYTPETTKSLESLSLLYP